MLGQGSGVCCAKWALSWTLFKHLVRQEGLGNAQSAPFVAVKLSFGLIGTSSEGSEQSFSMCVLTLLGLRPDGMAR